MTDQDTWEGAEQAASMDEEERERYEAEREDRLYIKALDKAWDMKATEKARRIVEAERRVAFAKALEDGDEGESPFTTYVAGDVRGRTIEPDILDGVIAYQGSLNLIAGHRGSMKSLCGLSIAGAVASGQHSLWGLDINLNGPVLYVYREGQQGLTRRLVAWEAYHRRQMKGVTFIHEPLDMREPEDVARLAILGKKLGAVLIILDPVARTGGGKEDAEDFGAYRLGLETLRDHTGAAVLVNHNTGHTAADRSRGHSTLEDAMDSCVAFIKRKLEEGGGTVMTDTKGRDSAPLEDIILQFTGAGPKGKEGQFQSGVPTVQSAQQEQGNAVRVLRKTIEPALALFALKGDDGATKAELVEAQQWPTNNLNRTLEPYLRVGLIKRSGATAAARYFAGPQA